MGWLRTIVTEVWGLFVDDLGLAIGALVWVGLIWIGASWLGPAAGPALFSGLALILFTSALRRAGQ